MFAYATMPVTDGIGSTRVVSNPAMQSQVNVSKASFQSILGGIKPIGMPKDVTTVEIKLTQMLLTKLFELMLPRNNENVVGGSATEDHWNSILAEAVAESAAKSGKFDLHLRGENAPSL